MNIGRKRNNMYHGNKKTKKDVQVISILLFFAFYAGIIVRGRFWDPGLSKPLSPPKAEAKEEEGVRLTPTPLPSPTPEPMTLEEQFKAEVREKFGEDYDNAMLLLQGNGPGSCAENRYFDPNADNDNTWWGGVGIDKGYWQINSYFHPHISEACARDIECSTHYAWRMYKNDGNSFRRWSCGKVYGI